MEVALLGDKVHNLGKPATARDIRLCDVNLAGVVRQNTLTEIAAPGEIPIRRKPSAVPRGTLDCAGSLKVTYGVVVAVVRVHRAVPWTGAEYTLKAAEWECGHIISAYKNGVRRHHWQET